MNPTDQLRLLIVHPSSDTAQGLYRQVRRLSLVVHWHWVASDKEALACLAEDAFDVCLWTAPSEIDEAREALRALLDVEPELCPIALLETFDPERFEVLLQCGAYDVLALEHPKLLPASVKRAFAQRQLLHSVQDLRSALFSSEQQAHTFLLASHEPMACLVGGLHSEINPAYLSCFGADHEDIIRATPFLNLVTQEDRGRVKQWLRQSLSEPIDIDCQTLRGQRFHCRLQSFQLHSDSEDGMLLVLRPSSRQSATPPALPDETELSLDPTEALSCDLLQHAERARALLTLQLPSAASADAAAAMEAHLPPHHARYRLADGTVSLLCDSANDTLLDQTRCWVEYVEHQSQARPSLSWVELAPTQSAEQALSQALDDLADPLCHLSPGLYPESTPSFWQSTLKDAIQHNRFALMETPLISLSGSKSEHFLLDLSLHTLERDLHTASLQRLAAQTHLARTLDRWLVLKALRRLIHAGKHKSSTCLWLPLSLDSLCDTQFAGWLGKTLEASHLDAKHLVLGFSMRAVMARQAEVLGNLNDLNLVGARVLLRDVSWHEPEQRQCIERLKPDFVAWPPALTQRLEHSFAAQQRLKDAVAQAAALDVASVASEVSNAQQLSILWQAGVEFMMGPFLSHSHSAQQALNL